MYIVLNKGATSFFCVWLFSFSPTPFVKETVLLPLSGLGTLLEDHLIICEGLFLGSIFYSIDLFICLYVKLDFFFFINFQNNELVSYQFYSSFKKFLSTHGFLCFWCVSIHCSHFYLLGNMKILF